VFYDNVEALFHLVGVASNVSADEVLSLSVICVESILSEPPIPPPEVRPLLVSVPETASLCVFILLNILLDFHYVHTKLYSSHSSKSPIDHQNLYLMQFFTNIELLPLPI